MFRIVTATCSYEDSNLLFFGVWVFPVFREPAVNIRRKSREKNAPLAPIANVFLIRGFGVGFISGVGQPGISFAGNIPPGSPGLPWIATLGGKCSTRVGGGTAKPRFHDQLRYRDQRSRASGETI